MIFLMPLLCVFAWKEEVKICEKQESERKKLNIYSGFTISSLVGFIHISFYFPKYEKNFTFLSIAVWYAIKQQMPATHRCVLDEKQEQQS